MKPFFDFIVAILLLVVLFPVFIITTFSLLMYHKGNPFFIQKRPGKEERLFSIIKFKTMSNKRDQTGKLLPDSERLSGFGKLIRSLSIDEIPQLVNVIKGDMSIVGPRPLLISYLPLYNKRQKKRHSVKPGITGLAQVNGRNAISWEEKFELDVLYVENSNFVLDLKILIKTVSKVFMRDDINSEGNVTTEPFKGNLE